MNKRSAFHPLVVKNSTTNGMRKVKKRPSSSTGTEIPRTKTGRKKPMCGRCDIHGVKVILEGHKMYCRYQDCNCPHCYVFLAGQRTAADNIARKRAYTLNKNKEISHVECVVSPTSLLYPTTKDNGLSSLLIYTLQEMYKSFTVWRNPAKIERIFRILANYAYEIDSRIKFNGFLESTKHWICQVISEEDPMSFMTFQQATTCCYIPPTQILHTPYKEQLDPLLKVEYPSQNFPVGSLISMTTTNMSLETLKSPSELSVKSFDTSIDSPTEPSANSPIEPLPDSPTDLSAKSSTYC